MLVSIPGDEEFVWLLVALKSTERFLVDIPSLGVHLPVHLLLVTDCERKNLSNCIILSNRINVSAGFALSSQKIHCTQY